jgi:hypothetical protein
MAERTHFAIPAGLIPAENSAEKQPENTSSQAIICCGFKFLRKDLLWYILIK